MADQRQNFLEYRFSYKKLIILHEKDFCIYSRIAAGTFAKDDYISLYEKKF
jgi:hypothetical protein